MYVYVVFWDLCGRWTASVNSYIHPCAHLSILLLMHLESCASIEEMLVYVCFKNGCNAMHEKIYRMDVDVRTEPDPYTSVGFIRVI